MKILMLVNWKIEYCNSVPKSKQPPDYCIKGEDYWFYRYFKNKPEVDVIDISSFPALENFEKTNFIFTYIRGLRLYRGLTNTIWSYHTECPAQLSLHFGNTFLRKRLSTLCST